MKALIILLLFFNLNIAANEPVVILCNSINKPACFEGENGEVVGIDVEIVKEVFKRLGIPVKFKLAPWKRVLRSVKNGTVDAGIPFFHTDEREGYSYYSKRPLHTSKMKVYINEKSQYKFQKLSDLYGKHIGIRRGYSVSPEFDRAKKEKKFVVVELESSMQLINMLKKGRIDFLVDKEATVKYSLKQGQAGLVEAGQIGVDIPAFFVFSKLSKIKNKRGLLIKIDKTLKQLINEGKVSKIVKKYSL